MKKKANGIVLSNEKIGLLLFAIVMLCFAELRAQNAENTFTDARDGKKYKTVKIGTQTWMSENLNYVTSSGSWCYNDSVKYCDKYGRLYDWEIAKSACPSGWHLPNSNEWINLIDYLGGKDIAGGKLKSKSGWKSPNKGTTNETGFSALAGGYKDGIDNLFKELGNESNFWSSTEPIERSIFGGKPRKVSVTSWYLLLHNKNENVSYHNYVKEFGLSVRCIKD